MLSAIDLIKQQTEGYELSHLSLENIKHQFNQEFVTKLLDEFRKINLDKRKPTTKSVAEYAIEKLVKDYLNINVSVQVVDFMTAGVPYTDFSITAKTPLAPNNEVYGFTDNGRRILKKTDKIDIKVDRISGKIYGVEDIDHTIIMGTEFLKSPGNLFTYKEACAIFLHELGHIWTYYYILPQMYMSAFLVGEFAETLLGIDTKDARAVVVKEAEALRGQQFVERERLVNASSRNEMALIIFTSEVERCKSIFGVNPYDMRNSEVMADQFVVRMGLGKDLATSQVKMNKMFGMVSKEYSWRRAIESTVITLALLPWTPFVLIISVIMSGNYITGEYDTPAKRVEVILQQLRHRYKEAKTKEHKATVAAEIKYLEELTKGDKDTFIIFDVLYKHILPWGRGESRRVNFAMALETLNNNSLLTRADSLKDLIQ